MKIPNLISSQLYTYGSFESADDGISFTIKNRLSELTILSVIRIVIDGAEAPLQQVVLVWNSGGDGRPGCAGFFSGLFGSSGKIEFRHPVRVGATEITSSNSLHIPLHRCIRVELPSFTPLQPGKHEISVSLLTEPFGELGFTVKDSVRKKVEARGGYEEETA